jgi:hypothetical protein
MAENSAIHEGEPRMITRATRRVVKLGERHGTDSPVLLAIVTNWTTAAKDLAYQISSLGRLLLVVRLAFPPARKLFWQSAIWVDNTRRFELA